MLDVSDSLPAQPTAGEEEKIISSPVNCGKRVDVILLRSAVQSYIIRIPFYHDALRAFVFLKLVFSVFFWPMFHTQNMSRFVWWQCNTLLYAIQYYAKMSTRLIVDYLQYYQMCSINIMTRFRFFISQLSSTPVYCAGKLLEVGRIGLNMVKYLNSEKWFK